MAYAEGCPLVGTSGDPEGWKILEPIKITGTISDVKSVNVEYTVRFSRFPYATRVISSSNVVQLAIATPVSLVHKT